MRRIGVKNLGRFRHAKVPSGPDRVDHFGPGWALKDRAKAAQGDAALPNSFSAMKDGLDIRRAVLSLKTPNRGDPLGSTEKVLKHATAGNPRAVVLAGLMQGPRHQREQKFIHQLLINRPGLRLRLYMGNGKYIFVQEIITKTTRMFSSSICYGSLARAKQVHKEGKITYIEFDSLPLTDIKSSEPG